MAYTTIKKPSDYFNTKLYSGNGSTQSITGVGFQPDFTWIKSRTTGGSGNNNHCINDVVRAKGSYGYPMIHPNLTASEYDPASGNEVITDFQSDGFDLGGSENSNYNTATYASWNWKANGAGVANTDGTISSTVSANTTSGFSIVSYTGTGSDATVGHGLGVTPKIVFFKRLDSSANWVVQAPLLGNKVQLVLNDTSAENTGSRLGASDNWSNSVFTVGTYGDMNASGGTYIAYCFSDVKGFSKMGSYTGNGNADGTFVYTGMKPAFVIVKRTDSAQGWYILDNKRNTFNPEDKYLEANDSDAEATFTFCNFLSNGFKAKTTGAGFNASGGSYIYMAFAEQPLVGDNPATAR